jgi:adenylate kinase
MNLILLGAPGAGKGTQGALLADRFGLSRLSTGDLLRDAVRRGTPLGQRAKGYMDAGELVPDAVILDLVREVLVSEPKGSGGFLLDGFPRTLPQAEALDRLLADLGRPLDAVVVIDVPDEVLVQRLSGRRSCPNCGAVYNIYFEPPREAGRCDRCGGALTERADDTAETVRHRLEVYRRQTEPLVDYYQGGPTPVHEVDGDRPTAEVERSIVQVLGS